MCTACMPELVPRCPMCGAPAAPLGAVSGFEHYAFWYLCPACVARVREAGPWKIRRARANEARVEALQARFPGLHVVETAPRRIALGGAVGERAVSITLKIAAREGEDERYIFRVALRTPRESIERAELTLDEALLGRLARGSPSITTDSHRWIRVGLKHLGKVDALSVLEGLLATAERIDRDASAP